MRDDFWWVGVFLQSSPPLDARWMRLLLLMLPCAWALRVPVQPPLVCPNIFNYYPAWLP